MSNEVAGLVQKRRLGGATRKAIMMYLADRASDDGSGIWTSKAHIAADTEFAKRSIVSVIGSFEEEGLLEKTGTRKCQNGFTFEYRIVLEAVRALPSTREKTGAGDSPVQEIHPTGAGDSPQGVQEIHPNHPLTTHEPSNARERADDLFSAENETDQQAERLDADFDRFWDVYPKKAAKKDAQKAWAKAIKRETPDRIVSAAEKYAAWLSSPSRPGEFKPHPKNAQGWLNGDRWADFTAKPTSYSWDDLRPAQQRSLADGRCPPSMMENGQPNEVAAFWLSQFRRAAE